MKSNLRFSVIIILIGIFVSCLILFLGYSASRLPEASIIVGCIMLAAASICAANIMLSSHDDECKMAYAGRQYVKAKCLCKYRNKISMIYLMLCKNGILIQGESLESDIMSYENITVGRMSKFGLQLIYKARGRKLTYDITLSNLIEVKAVIQVLSNQHVGLAFDMLNV